MILVGCSMDTSEESMNSSQQLLTKVNKEDSLEAYLNSLSPEAKEHREASMKLADYLEIENDLYVLKISKKDAQKLGISSDIYNKILKDLDITNKEIRKIRQNGGKIDLLDIKKEKEKFIRHNSITVRSGNQGRDQFGSISTLGQEEGHDYFYPEYDKSDVEFRCYPTTAPTPIIVCKTEVFGGLNSVSYVGNPFTFTLIPVCLAASGSNLCAKLSFSTTDSYGGKCDWFAVK